MKPHDHDRWCGRTDALERLAEELHWALLDGVRGEDLLLELPARVEQMVRERAAALGEQTRHEVSELILHRARGTGAIDLLLRDPEVDEILVSGTNPIWIERRGRLERTGEQFGSEDDLRLAIERLLAPLGRRVDEAEPICDARLPDGSRVNVVLPPLAVDGPSLSVRRFRSGGLRSAQLVESGSWEPELAELLRDAVLARSNILISGGTGAGKTTTLSAVAGFFGSEERVVTIEDTAELRLPLENVIRLESRPPGVEGRGEVSIRRLVRNALRMRPDRLIVGEVRGAEALDMLAALSTGHDGSLTTIHAGSPTEALQRLETLVMMAGVGLPHGTIRAQIGDAIDLVVQQVREPSGRRVVTRADAVAGDGADLILRPLYTRGDRAP